MCYLDWLLLEFPIMLRSEKFFHKQILRCATKTETQTNSFAPITNAVFPFPWKRSFYLKFACVLGWCVCTSVCVCLLSVCLCICVYDRLWKCGDQKSMLRVFCNLVPPCFLRQILLLNLNLTGLIKLTGQ